MTIHYLSASGDNHATKERFFQHFIENPPSIIALDVETISLKERAPIGFGVAVSADEGWYFPTYPEPCKEIELVLPLLRNPNVKKLYHNAPFDVRAFPLIADIDSTNIADTNVMARLMGNQITKLSSLYWIHNRHTTPVAEIIKAYQYTGSTGTTLDVPEVEMAKHCMQDVMCTYSLYEKLMPQIISSGLEHYLDVEMQALPIIIDMSLRGLKVDQIARQKFEDELKSEVDFYLDYCKNQMPSHLRFNPGSPQQVAFVLTERGNFLPFTKYNKNKKSDKKSLCTDKDTLKALRDPVASVVLNFRKSKKLLSTYVLPMKDEDRAYTEYNLDAVVGRISSSNINLQNIPPLMRVMYLPDNGVFTTGDYSQEHLRILCYLSGDKQMEDVYYHGAFGGDLHEKTAHDIGVSRQTAKTINYAIPYGATAGTIDQKAEMHDIRKAQEFLDGWFRSFPHAAEWLRSAQEYGLGHGWSLPTLFGRSIKLPDEGNYRSAKEAQARKAVNYPILGSDGEVMKRGIIAANEARLTLSATVHDSLTLDGMEDFPMDKMENITPFRLPFAVKRTLTWE